MLRITRETDYGIVLLTDMARHRDDAFTAASLAERQHLPVPMVSKVLKALARAGILESRRGAQGGYSLAMTPEKVSAASIIEALEGPIAITECTQDDSACVHEGHCGMSNHWMRINTAIRTALEHISLGELSQVQHPVEFIPRASLALNGKVSLPEVTEPAAIVPHVIEV